MTEAGPTELLKVWALMRGGGWMSRPFQGDRLYYFFDRTGETYEQWCLLHGDPES